jgi:hypothetical protein
MLSSYEAASQTCLRLTLRHSGRLGRAPTLVHSAPLATVRQRIQRKTEMNPLQLASWDSPTSPDRLRLNQTTVLSWTQSHGNCKLLVYLVV